MLGLLTVVIGALVALQSRLNGQLATAVHNGIGGAVLSNLVGFSMLWILVFSMKRERAGLKRVFAAYRTKEVKIWEFFGGFGGGFGGERKSFDSADRPARKPREVAAE